MGFFLDSLVARSENRVTFPESSKPYFGSYGFYYNFRLFRERDKVTDATEHLFQVIYYNPYNAQEIRHAAHLPGVDLTAVHYVLGDVFFALYTRICQSHSGELSKWTGKQSPFPFPVESMRELIKAGANPSKFADFLYRQEQDRFHDARDLLEEMSKGSLGTGIVISCATVLLPAVIEAITIN